MRSPSGTAVGSTRGLAPVASSTASASRTSAPPSDRSTSMWCTARPPGASAKRARPSMISTPAISSLWRMSADWAAARLRTRSCTYATSMVMSSSSTTTPNRAASRTAVRPPADAMNVLDGTQSNSTQLPPGPAGSTRVTWPPYWAATSAASYPAGPPPSIRIRAMGPPERLRPRAARPHAIQPPPDCHPSPGSAGDRSGHRSAPVTLCEWLCTPHTAPTWIPSR